MRILVISDSHGNGNVIENILNKHSEVREVFFLGDVTKDIEDLPYIYTDKIFHIVSGNCDFFSQYPYTDIAVTGGKKIMFTHGHTYGVKGGIGALKSAAKQNGCDIVLYGHTHIPYTEYDDGLYVVNPGSVSRGRDSKCTYAVVDIEKNGILPVIIEL